MKSTEISILSRAWKHLVFGGGVALTALTLSVQAETFDVDVSDHVLYTDPVHPERQIFLGGFSGLIPVPGDTSGRMFYTVTDRGPTQDIPVVTIAPDGTTVITTTYKVLPCAAMAPMIVKLQIHPSGKVRVVQTTPLRKRGLHGFEPIYGFANGVELAPEVMCDVFYKPLPFDPDGLDPEGITIDDEGYFWICEEYRPSIARVRPDGTVVLRLVPEGCLTGTETIPTLDILPAVLAKRVNNRGMEGITYSPNGCLYAVVQRPLANPTKKVSEASCNLRIVEVNLRALLSCADEPVVRQLVYRLDDPANKSAYASDIFALSSDVMLVPERQTDKLFAIDISEATDITGLETEDGKLMKDPNLTLEQLTTAAQLADFGIQPVKKAVVAPSMIALHKDLAKCEGIAVVGDTIVLTYDNDFNMHDFGDGSQVPGSIGLKSPAVYPALITLPLP